MRRVAGGWRCLDWAGIVEIQGLRRGDCCRALGPDDDMRIVTGDPPRAQLQRGGRADQLAAFPVVGIAKQRVDGDFDEIGIAVIGVAIGEGELRAFRNGVNEFCARWPHRFEIESLQKRQLLEENRSLAPRSGLADPIVAVVVDDRLFDARTPDGHVVAAEEPAMALAGGVLERSPAEEAVDGFGDEALVPDAARRLDLAEAIAARSLGLAQDALETGCQMRPTKA